MKIHIETVKVKKMIETEVDSEEVVLRMSKEDALLLRKLTGNIGGGGSSLWLDEVRIKDKSGTRKVVDDLFYSMGKAGINYEY